MNFRANMVRFFRSRNQKKKWRFQEASKNWSIFELIFYRFWLRFGSQLGAMLATPFGPRRPKTGQEARQAAILDGPLSLLKRSKKYLMGPCPPKTGYLMGPVVRKLHFSSIFASILVRFLEYFLPYPKLVLSPERRQFCNFLNDKSRVKRDGGHAA